MFPVETKNLFSLMAFSLLTLLTTVTLWQWHRADKYKDFTLLDFVAEGGKLSARKAFETGAFLITSTGFILHAIKNPVSPELMFMYASIWVVARTSGQVVHGLVFRRQSHSDEVVVSDRDKNNDNDRPSDARPQVRA
jgi:hypothetical protein